jgi:hypothetical protein
MRCIALRARDRLVFCDVFVQLDIPPNFPTIIDIGDIELRRLDVAQIKMPKHIGRAMH